MSFFSGHAVTQEYVDAHSGAAIDAVSAATVASAATLDLTGLDGAYQIDVTGTTTITAITLAEGVEHVLRVTNAAGLTFTHGASLLCPGGVSIVATQNSWGIFRGGAAGVVTCLWFQDDARYSKQTFGNVYMKTGANIGFDGDPGAFYVGKSSTGEHLRFGTGEGVRVMQYDGLSGADLRLDLLTNLRSFNFPDHDGTFLTHDDDLGTPTAGVLTNCTGYPGIPTVGSVNVWQKSDGANLVNSQASDDGTDTIILGPGGLVAIGDVNLVGHGNTIVVSDAAREIHIKGDTTFLDNLTSDGFVRTSGGSGELTVDQTVYSTFDGAFSSLSAKPTTIGGYGITNFNSLGDARWQPLDTSATARLNLAIL